MNNELLDIIPGIARVVTYTITLPDTVTAASAVLKIKENETDADGYAIVTKNINTVSGADGIVSGTTLTFKLSAIDTALIDPLWAYYVYSVSWTGNDSVKRYAVNLARLRAIQVA